MYTKYAVDMFEIDSGQATFAKWKKIVFEGAPKGDNEARYKVALPDEYPREVRQCGTRFEWGQSNKQLLIDNMISAFRIRWVLQIL
jgi:hypothetical protein